MEHADTQALVPEQLETEIRKLDWRDLQLWCLGGFVLLVVAAGFLSLLIPQVLWQAQSVLARQPDAPQLVFGLIMLLVLLNIYLFQQRRLLLRTRQYLINQLQIAERTARTDSLTGIYNRRFMQEALVREIARAERNQSKLSVVLVDIDGFKDFNTRFGHLIGDRVLIEVTHLLQKNFRASDFITRFGGDEFLVIMPETDLIQAMVSVDRLGRLIERWNGRENRDFAISVCCGAAVHLAGTTAEEMLQAADADLYVHKASRNEAKMAATPTEAAGSVQPGSPYAGAKPRQARVLL
ncbi:MAG TPA: GGDEF domain-containing protein [Terriglobales bacterium]|nr:GGDEF domain-containing protein [Terriglobales bacterium]